jgi:hypothetical protein
MKGVWTCSNLTRRAAGPQAVTLCATQVPHDRNFQAHRPRHHPARRRAPGHRRHRRPDRPGRSHARTHRAPAGRQAPAQAERTRGIAGLVYKSGPRRHARGGRQHGRAARPAGAGAGQARTRPGRPSAKPSWRRSTACWATTWWPPATRWPAHGLRLAGARCAGPALGCAACHATPPAGPRPVHERPAVAARRPRPRRALAARPGLHAGLPALQQRPACVDQWPAAGAAAGAAARRLAACRCSGWCCWATAWAAW